LHFFRIHGSTLGIETGCFADMTRLTRVLTKRDRAGAEGHPAATLSAAALNVFVRKLAGYEPALVDAIREMVEESIDIDMHRVGDRAFHRCQCGALLVRHKHNIETSALRKRSKNRHDRAAVGW
jgi:hypothetical protein